MPTPPGSGCSSAGSAPPARPTAAAVVATTGSSSLRTRAPSAGYELDQPALHGPVRLERAVAVQVVRGDVGVDRRRRVPRDSVGSCSSESSSTTRWPRRQLRQALDERRADVAAEQRRPRRPRRARPRSARWWWSCPWCPVTPTVGAGQRRRKRSTSLTTGTRPSASTRAERGAQARLGGREAAADRRRGRRPAPGRASTSAGSTSGPSRRRTGAVLERRRSRLQLARAGAHVVDGHRARRDRPGSGPARSPLRARPSTATGRPAKRSEVEACRGRSASAGRSSRVTGPACPRVAEEEDHADHRRQHADDPEAERDLLLVPARAARSGGAAGSSGRRACRRVL